LVKDFDPKCIGVIYDPGNMIVEGRESWKMGLELLGDYLAHVHVKNLLWQYGEEDYRGNKCERGWHWAWADMDKGMVDWQEVIRTLKATGYKGYLSLEDFSPSPIEERLKTINYLRGLEKDED
jgi:sugar phosphate isomerase/epimerase